ncbi:MAG: 1,6-anhydro-N-acetylmuramyl-L-alanine amidase AmpD [Magnetococcales bacterium]|nr:1,6-anhydro-N-acetylmuramyl-L-alanine amidase AmpD [Magnetococcales bacterium]
MTPCKTTFRYLPSTHCGLRPDGVQIDLLVVHAISLPPGEFGGCGVDDLFLGCLDGDAHPFYREIANLKVSAHFLIKRDGTLTQYVPAAQMAWHAGVSQWQGRNKCNDFSIGVELEGDENTAFEIVQYQQLATLTRTLQGRYPTITDKNIVGHKDIAPNRKWDPGPGFDWQHFYKILSTAKATLEWPIVWD